MFAGAETVDHDFANFNLSTLVPGSVSGTVWNDQNGNGILDTAPVTEPGLGGRTVFADANGNGLLDATDPQTTTNTDGTYTISGIAPGTINIYDVVPAGWRATSPLTGVRSLVLKNGENVIGINYGNAEPRNSTISGTVFADTTKNGVRDSGEHGLAGITVYLDLNHNGTLDAADLKSETSTDLYYTPSVNEAGAYSFAHLASGTYSVRQVIPAELSSTPLTQFEHSVTMLAAENHSGVDFADVFRLNEIHGVKFDDSNGNHVRDTDESGVGGTTIFIDSDRDDVLDVGELSTVTLSDGSYSFTGLSPGAYVVREVLETVFGHSFPRTTGGILWPDGISNPAQGIVSPSSITTSLAVGQSFHQTVSLTLPGTGSLTNAVDVFLLFDDTGSFVNNSPIVRAAFPNIITQLQTSLSGTDLAFGVGRFEEYGNFASEYSTGRPFVLNQPMVASSTPGYMTAIQAALNRQSRFLRVLMAKSRVGREGMNLHHACRTVVLLHPEWNPAVVEQQIGRVERVGSYWAQLLNESVGKFDVGKAPGFVPNSAITRIEVRFVIFQGTYDEHPWSVLRTRWDDQRAQLHCIVIPPSEQFDDPVSKALLDEIAKAAPDFSPLATR